MDACSTHNLTIFENQTLLDIINDARAKQLSPVIAYLAILMFIGISGNSLVIYIYGTRFKRTSAAYFILWLAVLDLLSCTFGLPFEIADIWFNSNFTAAAVCKIFRLGATVIIMMSALCLLLVAFDRYFKVCKPHRRPPFSSLKQLVGLSIVITALCSWPTLFTFGIEDINVMVPSRDFLIAGSICSTDNNTSTTIIRVYWVILGIIFITSAIFMVVVYAMLIYSLYKNEAEMSAKRTSDMSEKTFNTLTKIGRTTRLFVGITAVFIISFLPMLVLIVVETVSKFCEQSLAADVVTKIFIRSQYINNVANPFLYGFYNPLFRRECKLILFKRVLVYFRCTRYNVDEVVNSIEDQSSNALNTDHRGGRFKTRAKRTSSPM